MGDGPKRFSLSDYQSARRHARPAEAAAFSEQKSELEELHMLLGTGIAAGDAEGGSGSHEVLRTPGASPDRYEGSPHGEEDGSGTSGAGAKRSSRTDNGGRSRDSSRDSRDSNGSARHDRSRGRSSKDDRDSRHRRSRRKRSRSSRSPSRSPSRTQRRSRARERSRSRSRSSDRASSRSRSRSSHERRSRNPRSPHRSRSRSQSQSRDKISIRCVFPYEDGGIIIGLRGAHLTKLREAVSGVEWRISNETNNRQDRILVVRGTVKRVSEAFCALAEHFISQGMHVDYPPQTRGRGTKEVDTSKPFVPIRLLFPHKSCGAIIGQKSETLINTRVDCAARRVYVYRERISESRERVVEVVGTPMAIYKVMMVLGGQVARTLTSDQLESDPYVPERDGLRNFLCKQGPLGVECPFAFKLAFALALQ
ncbi:RNA binding protein, heterogenous nuclear RNP-K like protein [Coemansia biformis]|uniref:RNA binding protein, heterogenous nuclear RNP-K like protein n=1 Tax=Coemansia biformis TaxID=1286918 RepID=A0A9W7YEB3_9FUNG|nr:RNA binding protein, heterogenous nuclear RNP-K like protein [Coemansia biformis]